MTSKKRTAHSVQAVGGNMGCEMTSDSTTIVRQPVGVRKPVLPPLRFARAELVASIVGDDPDWPFELTPFGYEELKAAGLTRCVADRAIADLIAMGRLEARAAGDCVVLVAVGAEG